MVIGITGGIGSGKTTVAKEFEKIGIPVFIADVEAKKIISTSEKVKVQLLELFGEKAFVSGELNRKYIASQVFNDKNLLQKLNEIIHPEVHIKLSEFVNKANSPYVVYESAILFENKNEHLCDKIIVVTAPLEDRVLRVMKRDGVSKEAVMDRIKNQMSQEEKVKKADFILENIQEKDIYLQVLKIHSVLIETNF